MSVNGKKFSINYIRIYIQSHLSMCLFVKVDNQNYQDFGISTGKHRACTYYASQETCGGPQSNFGVLAALNGQSLNQQRAETLMTITGWIRGSFVSKLHFYNKYNKCFI